MSARDLARLMRTAGIKPRTRPRRPPRNPEPPPARPSTRRVVNAFQEVPLGAENDPQSVYQVPDAWEAPKSVQRQVLRQAQGEPEEAPQPGKRRGRKKRARHKRRAVTVSICVSTEEEFYLRKFASDKGMGFSEWARVSLFKAMKTPIPDRD